MLSQNNFCLDNLKYLREYCTCRERWRNWTISKLQRLCFSRLCPYPEIPQLRRKEQSQRLEEPLGWDVVYTAPPRCTLEKAGDGWWCFSNLSSSLTAASKAETISVILSFFLNKLLLAPIIWVLPSVSLSAFSTDEFWATGTADPKDDRPSQTSLRSAQRSGKKAGEKYFHTHM